MKASRQEVRDSLAQWNVIRIRMAMGLRFVNNADRRGLEDFEKSLDFMRRQPMKLPKKLRPELQELFKLRKGTKLFPSLKGINSLSDTEFFSPMRFRMQELGHGMEL